MADWVERAWLQRYLDRRLTESENAWFETYVLDKHELLAEIDADTHLSAALHAAPARVIEAAVATPATGTPARAGRRRGLALVASLLAGFALAWLLRGTMGNNAGDSLMVDPTRVVFDTTRGVEVDVRIQNAASASPWAVVDVAVPWNATEISVTRPHSGPQPLSPSVDGFVTFIVVRDALSSKDPPVLRYVVNGVRFERRLGVPNQDPQR
jgi:hypothetical protein